MLRMLNYAPEDVKTSEVIIASMSGSGVAFGILPHEVGQEPEAVVIAPKLVRAHNLRIGDTVDVGYVENFPEHVQRVKWRAVAVYPKTAEDDKPVHGKKPGDVRRTIEQQVQEVVMSGEVWSRGELYVELFGESFKSLTASEVERARYEAVGHALQRLHDTSVIACAKVYGPGKKNATALYYAKNTCILGRALMGLDVTDQEGEDES